MARLILVAVVPILLCECICGYEDVSLYSATEAEVPKKVMEGFRQSFPQAEIRCIDRCVFKKRTTVFAFTVTDHDQEELVANVTPKGEVTLCKPREE